MEGLSPSKLSPTSRAPFATREGVKEVVKEEAEETQRFVEAQIQRVLDAVRTLEGEITRQRRPTHKARELPRSSTRSHESLGGSSPSSHMQQQISNRSPSRGARAEVILSRAGINGALPLVPSQAPLGRSSSLFSVARSDGPTDRAARLQDEEKGGPERTPAGAEPSPAAASSRRAYLPMASGSQVSEATVGAEQQQQQQGQRRSTVNTRPMSKARRCSASVLGLDGVELTPSEMDYEKEKERQAKLGLTQALGMGKSVSRRRSFEEVTNKVAIEMERNYLQDLVQSSKFELLSGIIIVANVIAMGLQANERVRAPYESCEHMTWNIVNLCFNIFFVVEVSLRIVALRKRFLKGKDKGWNLFDLVIVTSGVMEEMVQWIILLTSDCQSDNGGIGAGIDALRIIRVLRLIRLARVIRVMHNFTELRIMVRSILVCLAPLCWACMLLLLIQWCFGVFFCTIAADHITAGLSGKSGAEKDEWLRSPVVADLLFHWGSLWKALYTLFLSVTNGLDWSEAAESMDPIGVYPTLAYILYVALTSFAVLNVVTGVFVENAMKIALRDRDLQVQVQLDQRKKIMERLLSVFNEADNDRDGTITWDDFEKHIGDPKVQAFFNHLELGGADAGRLFRLLDRNGNGKVDAEEFVTGCLVLRGGAKTMDVAAVMLEQRIFMEYFAEQLDGFREALASAQGLDQPTPPVCTTVSHLSSIASTGTAAPTRAALACRASGDLRDIPV